MADTQLLPTHLGFILDGNRRWAKQHSLPKFDGHLAGYNALKEVIRATFEAGVKYVSIYAFSTENWQRDKTEVSSLMKLSMIAMRADLPEAMEKQWRIRFCGQREGLGDRLIKGVDKAEEATRHFTDRTLNICFNYGGQREIMHAVQACGQDGIRAEDITEEDIAAHLYNADVPPVDMIVRTSGEQRLSNFMLWRAAYSELMFIDKFWPDMTREDVAEILKEYSKRNRRFGGQ